MDSDALKEWRKVSREIVKQGAWYQRWARCAAPWVPTCPVHVQTFSARVRFSLPPSYPLNRIWPHLAHIPHCQWEGVQTVYWDVGSESIQLTAEPNTLLFYKQSTADALYFGIQHVLLLLVHLLVLVDDGGASINWSLYPRVDSVRWLTTQVALETMGPFRVDRINTDCKAYTLNATGQDSTSPQRDGQKMLVQAQAQWRRAGRTGSAEVGQVIREIATRPIECSVSSNRILKCRQGTGVAFVHREMMRAANRNWMECMAASDVLVLNDHIMESGRVDIKQARLFYAIRRADWFYGTFRYASEGGPPLTPEYLFGYHNHGRNRRKYESAPPRSMGAAATVVPHPVKPTAKSNAKTTRTRQQGVSKTTRSQTLPAPPTSPSLPKPPPPPGVPIDTHMTIAPEVDIGTPMNRRLWASCYVSPSAYGMYSALTSQTLLTLARQTQAFGLETFSLYFDDPHAIALRQYRQLIPSVGAFTEPEAGALKTLYRGAHPPVFSELTTPAPPHPERLKVLAGPSVVSYRSDIYELVAIVCAELARYETAADGRGQVTTLSPLNRYNLPL